MAESADPDPSFDLPGRPGEALVVPKGVRHRLDVLEPAHLVHLTLGPGQAAIPTDELERPGQ